MNPLEHHSFRRLLEKRKTVVTSSEATFTLRSYRYVFWNAFRAENKRAWWHLITLTGVSSFLKNQATQRGLLLVDGFPVCVTCQTNEFVKSDEKLNCGTPTCTRCYSIFKGWE